MKAIHDMPQGGTMNTKTRTVIDPLLRDGVASRRTYESAPATGTDFLKSQVRIQAHFDERMAAKATKRAQHERQVRSSHLTSTVADAFPQG